MFKIGDKVRITKGFLNRHNLFFADGMELHIGKMGIVTDIDVRLEHLIVQVDRDSWYWLPECIEHVDTFHEGDVVCREDGFLYRLGKAGKPGYFNYSTIKNGKWKQVGDAYIFGLFDDRYKVVTKYQLRNSKGHFIPCDRDVNPKHKVRHKPVKAAKAADRGVVAKPAIIKPVAPVKPLPAPPEAKDIRSELAKRAKAGYEANRCNYSIEFDNGEIRHQAPDACHARLCWSGYADEDTRAKAIVNIALNITPHFNGLSMDNKKIYPKFVNYMLNESPWAFCFVTKDVKEALEVGILMDVNQNVSHIVGAAVSLRLATEFPATLKPFGDALDKGYSGNVAHLISGHLMEGRVTEWPYHSALTSSLNKEAIIKFFKTGYANKLPAIDKDRKQTSYKIFDTISPGAGYGGNNVGDGESLSKFVVKQAVSTKRGKGFEAKTIFDYEATLIKMADAFTKELA